MCLTNGFSFKIGYNATALPPNTYYAEPISSSGSSSTTTSSNPLPSGYSLLAFMHSHTDESGPSPFDLYELNNAYKKGNTSFTTSFVINNAGEIFAMVVTDRTLFSEFAAKYLKDSDVNLNSNDGEFSGSSAIKDAYLEYRQGVMDDKSNPSSNSSIGDAFAGALGQIVLDNKGGVSIYKYDTNTGNFRALGIEKQPVLDMSGNVITITKTKKCPQ